ncbi:hypothetical protein B0O99DRAFT_491930, partial [Bisporella sp. PMI_857]
LVLGGPPGVEFIVSPGALSSRARVFIASSSTVKVYSTVERLQTTVPSTAVLVSGHHFGPVCELLLQPPGVAPDHIVFTASNVAQIQPIGEAIFDNTVIRAIVRFFAPRLLAKHVRAHMRSNAASSITLTGALTSDMALDNYAASRIARTLSIDLAPIRVNVIKIG